MTLDEINWYNINEHQEIKELPLEEWKYSKTVNEHFNCGDYFQVSNYGRVRRHSRKGTFVFKISDNGSGYKKFACTYNSVLKNFYIHRLVAEMFHPNPKDLPQVNHKQTGLGKFDNRAEHLEWCTEKENIKDAHKNGQMVNRTRVHTQIDIKSDIFIVEMYRRYKETGKVGETAREFGVPRTTLSSIVNKRSRVDITDPIDLEFN